MKFLRLADLSPDRLIRYARFLGAVLLLVVGQPAYAISYGGPTFSGLVQNTLLPMGNQAVAVLVAVAVAIFFVGMVRYIFSAGDERSKEYGRSLMVWGVMALVVVMCIGGILLALKDFFFSPSTSFYGGA